MKGSSSVMVITPTHRQPLVRGVGLVPEEQLLQAGKSPDVHGFLPRRRTGTVGVVGHLDGELVRLSVCHAGGVDVVDGSWRGRFLLRASEKRGVFVFVRVIVV